MAQQERILYTGLPNGVTHSARGEPLLRLTVLITPRLYAGADSTLDQWDFLHWPQKLAGIQFSVTFTGGGNTETLLARNDPQGITADEALWEALFPGSTYVRPYAFDDFSPNFVISHQAAYIMQYLESTYKQVAYQLSPAYPSGIPDRQTLEGVLGSDNQTLTQYSDDSLGSTLRQAKARYNNFNGQPSTFPLYAPGQTAEDFLRVRLFHYRPAGYNPNAPNDLNGPLASMPKMDFHQAVASMTRYPSLLRRLGLAVDLLVPFDPRLPRDPASSTLQIVPTWSSPPAVLGAAIAPLTAYTLTTTDFTSTPKSNEMSRGMVNLNATKNLGGTTVPTYTLIQVDVDGAALKLVNLAASLQRMATNYDYTYPNDPNKYAVNIAGVATPTTAGLPSLRSAGIFLAKTGRANDLCSGFQSARAANSNAEAGTAVTMYAENLTRGYRVDIRNVATGRWYSLCRRIGTYHFDNAPAAKQNLTIEDEGIISGTGVTQDPSTPPFNGTPADLYLHENIVRWDGWSLCAPRPGDTVGLDNSPSTPMNTAGDFKMETNFVAQPGSLPRLRFGSQYQMRVRTVDLSGNSLPYNTPIADLASAPLTYLRYDPILAPAIILPYDVAAYPGETVGRLVVRSDAGGTPEQEVAFLGSAPLPYTGFRPDAQRHIVPPRTSELMAEAHGMFDLPPANPVVMDGAAYSNINGSGKGISSLDGALTEIDSNQQVTLPYLPDPIARGATFFPMPSVTYPLVTKQAFDGAWPFLQPFRLRLQGIADGQTAQAPQWDSTNRILTAQLAQGDRLTTRVSSYMNGDDLVRLGVWQWMVEQSGQGIASYQTLALAGLNWMLSPYHELDLVHAVQRPLIRPAFNTLVAQKTAMGQTYAVLVNQNADSFPVSMPISGKSTVKLDLDATWSEPSDDPTDDPADDTNGVEDAEPQTINAHAHVVEVPIEPGDSTIPFDPASNRRHEFGDTKYRQVVYTATGTTRFKEYFPITDADIAAGKAPPTTYTQSSAPQTVDVPNSARPDTPKVLYVIPVFEWSKSNPAAGQFATQRLGGRLRIYLERPWFSSGAGELLGVVVRTKGAAASAPSKSTRGQQSGAALRRTVSMLSRSHQQAPTDPLKAFVTQWGMDPLWYSGSLDNPPTTGNFPLATPLAGPLAINPRDGLTLDEVPNVTVAVAGHTVKYDADRDLWYADIEVSGAASYYPFIRLALARYQPISIALPNNPPPTDAYLSRVVLADFAQLAPDRTATITTRNNSSDLNQITVSVNGLDATDGLLRKNLVEVSVQQQQPGVQGDLAWVPVPNATHELPASLSGWSKTFDLPRPPGSMQFRLIIKEYEPMSHTDDASGNLDSARRLVYATTVDV